MSHNSNELHINGGGIGDCVFLLNWCYNNDIKKIITTKKSIFLLLKLYHNFYFLNPPNLVIQHDETIRPVKTKTFPKYHDTQSLWPVVYEHKKENQSLKKIDFSLKLYDSYYWLVSPNTIEKWYKTIKTKCLLYEECEYIESITKKHFFDYEISFLPNVLKEYKNVLTKNFNDDFNLQETLWEHIIYSKFMIITEGGAFWHCLFQNVPCIYYTENEEHHNALMERFPDRILIKISSVEEFEPALLKMKDLLS